MTETCVLLEREETAIATVASTSPLTHPIGCYGVDETGHGAFHWFRDPGELVDFLLTMDVALPRAEASERARRRAHLRDLVSSSGPNRAVVGRLNQIVGSRIEIRWCGSFRSLCSSRSEFCRETREAFWDSNEEDDSRAIPEEQRAAFATFLLI